MNTPEQVLEAGIRQVEAKLKKARVHPHYSAQILAYIDLLHRHGIIVDGTLLYGSVARGTARFRESDVDLIMVADFPGMETLPYGQEFRRLQRAVARERPDEVMARWMTPRILREHFLGRAGFVLDALYEGSVLLDQSGYIAALKEELDRDLAAGKYRREKGTWIWPLLRVGDVIEM